MIQKKRQPPMQGKSIQKHNAVSKKNVSTYLKMIDEIFGIEKILSSVNDTADTIAYYRASHLAYSILHSRQGVVHMALSVDGSFSKEDYKRQPEYIEEIIRKDSCKRILELGSGNGYNSIWLANNNPDVQFSGIDLTPSHIKNSKKSSKNITNLQFIESDFEDTHLQSNSYDLIFAVESVCHANDLEKVLLNAFHMLNEGGTIVIFDGFRRQNPDDLEPNLCTVTKLVEKSMAVRNGRTTTQFMKALVAAGFKDMVIEDFSENIMPNLLKLQSSALHFFKNLPRAKFIKALLPFRLVQNAVAGLFMPFTVEQKIQGYYRIVAKKRRVDQ